MESNLTQFLFAELLLLLVSALLTLVGYMLKRHVGAVDAMGKKVEVLTEQVTRLLERDRLQRLADYKTERDV